MWKDSSKMIYYKVVDENLMSYFSCFEHIGGMLNIQYKVNEWVFPVVKVAPLMVFDNLEIAKLFSRANRLGRINPKIFECEIKKSRKKWTCLATDKTIMQAIKLKKAKKKCSFLDPALLMQNCVLADSVKLTREIDV